MGGAKFSYYLNAKYVKNLWLDRSKLIIYYNLYLYYTMEYAQLQNLNLNLKNNILSYYGYQYVLMHYQH